MCWCVRRLYSKPRQWQQWQCSPLITQVCRLRLCVSQKRQEQSWPWVCTKETLTVAHTKKVEEHFGSYTVWKKNTLLIQAPPLWYLTSTSAVRFLQICRHIPKVWPGFLAGHATRGFYRKHMIWSSCYLLPWFQQNNAFGKWIASTTNCNRG